MEILGIDAGNHSVKAWSEKGGLIFPSLLGEFRDIRLNNSSQKFDMVYEYEGLKGFAGTLALRESEHATSMMGDNKAHSQTLLRILLALFNHCSSPFCKIAIGQPISKHTSEYKAIFERMLLNKTHNIKVNGVSKRFIIKDLIIIPEAGSTFWSNPENGLVRVMDFGSGTVNCATLQDAIYIDKHSFTYKYGMNSNITNDVKSIVDKTCINTLNHWDDDDTVIVSGGMAYEILPIIKTFYRNARVIVPKPLDYLEDEIIHPVFANSVGNYNLAKEFFKD